MPTKQRFHLLLVHAVFSHTPDPGCGNPLCRGHPHNALSEHQIYQATLTTQLSIQSENWIANLSHNHREYSRLPVSVHNLANLFHSELLYICSKWQTNATVPTQKISCTYIKTANTNGLENSEIDLLRGRLCLEIVRIQDISWSVGTFAIPKITTMCRVGH